MLWQWNGNKAFLKCVISLFCYQMIQSGPLCLKYSSSAALSPQSLFAVCSAWHQELSYEGLGAFTQDFSCWTPPGTSPTGIGISHCLSLQPPEQKESNCLQISAPGPSLNWFSRAGSGVSSFLSTRVGSTRRNIRCNLSNTHLEHSLCSFPWWKRSTNFCIQPPLDTEIYQSCNSELFSLITAPFEGTDPPQLHEATSPKADAVL